MYVTHSYSTIPPSALEVKVGELATSFSTGYLYTKNLNSDILKVGVSKSKLVDFNEFKPTSFNNNYFLSFTKLNNDVVLSTTLPFINISRLNGTLISDLQDNQYLGFNEDLEVENLPQPNFNILELADVDYRLELTEELNNYVLTFVSGNGPATLNGNKDYFNTANYYGTWLLLPEASKLTAFDDVRTPDIYTEENPIPIYSVVRNVRRGETATFGQNKKLNITPLSIGWDKEPKLSNDLICNQYAISSEGFNIQTLQVENIVSTVTLDLDKYKVFSIECSDDVLNLNISFSDFAGDVNTLRTYAVYISNYSNFVQFDPRASFENGILNELIGKNHLYVINAYKTVQNYNYMIFYKSPNLIRR